MRNMSAPSNNFIIKKCEFSQREEKTLRTAGKKSKKRRELMLAKINQEKINQVISTEQIKSLTMKNDKHTACQRFLERGNKPVPPNYEEQDVLPPGMNGPNGQQNRMSTAYAVNSYQD